MTRGLLLALLLVPVARAESSSDAIARGDAAWALRASDDGADAARSSEARAAYEDAVRIEPSSLEARFRLLDALWFDGHFAQPDRADKRRTFTRMTAVAEGTVALTEARAGTQATLDALAPDERARRVGALPNVADAHFWAAIAWGLWASSHGNAACGLKGVAAKVRDHATVLVAVDERFADAGGLRLLGRLHSQAPRVPLFTGWIDRDEGLRLLERANAISEADPRNPLYLAEALLDRAPSRRDEALELLRGVAARTADPAHRLEQQEIIDEARRVLADQEHAATGGRP